ncbi:mevalonate kinase family protein [Xylocopilactobacillus apis]|uniref:Phosphomevalonate kinase n=1 Tax=Xylocopilactobacillus apis TaxID=2932183 RepID=A0AAU9D9F5_9LACO|nr:hypothetical protein [Xylocopilactobacillus apis]BDR56295.1 phosphomevalonate kinase [Xylocopilactobacillus apis]
MIKIKVPGKLFISGEYAAVSPLYHSLIVPVNRYLSVQIKFFQNEFSIIKSGQKELKVNFIKLQTELEVSDYWLPIFKSLKTVRSFLLDKKINLNNFSLIIESDLEDLTYGKIGLGSSGAITVATIKAILALYKVEINATETYHLALKAQIDQFQESSFGDIAIASFQKPIYYQKPKNLDSPLKIQTFSWPSNLKLFIGFTGEPYKTSMGVNKFNNLPAKVKTDFSQKVDELTNLLYRNLINDQPGVTNVFQNIANLYWNFDLRYNLGIFSPPLKKLVLSANKLKIPAKQSGAGGGDCGIAIACEQKKESLYNNWEHENIIPLNLEVVN